MAAPADSMNLSRRGLLTGAAALPALAVPVAPAVAIAAEVPADLIEAYSSWLYYERELLHVEAFGSEAARGLRQFVWLNNAGADYHFPSGASWRDRPQPSTRAGSVFRLLGVDWRERA
jgi:hypothetical protein